MTVEKKQAIKILAHAYWCVHADDQLNVYDHDIALIHLGSAIRYLSRPERFYYPKTRRATKGAPIVCR